MAQVCPAPEQGRLSNTRILAHVALASLAVGWLAPPTARAEPTLSLAAAERLAIERDAVLQQLAAESAGMRERAVAEGQLMDPRLRMGAVNVPTDSFSLTQEDMTMMEVGVSQEFPAGRTLELSRRRMEQIATASRLRRATGNASCSARFAASGSNSPTSRPHSASSRTSRRGWTRCAPPHARGMHPVKASSSTCCRRAWTSAMLKEQQLDLDREWAMRRAQLARWLGAEDAARAGPFTLPARGDLPRLAGLEQRLLQHPAQQDYERRIEAAQTAVELARAVDAARLDAGPELRLPGRRDARRASRVRTW